MRTLVNSVVTVLMLTAACTAFGAGGGEMPNRSVGSASRLDQNTPTPEEQARALHNTGVRAVEKADALGADAARQTDVKKQAKVLEKSKAGYASALKKFSRATEIYPESYESWNYAGYCNRKLGNFEPALAAYDRALALKPGYAEAIEYRGHAYLGLDRLSEAKEAYLTLFAANRQLASQLLEGMQAWIGAHRGNPAGVDGVMLDSFASWVSERKAIAGQTASLTREGAVARW